MGSITVVTTGGSGDPAEEVISFTQEGAPGLMVTTNPAFTTGLAKELGDNFGGCGVTW